MKKNVYISLCCPPEMNTTLLTILEFKKCKKKKIFKRWRMPLMDSSLISFFPSMLLFSASIVRGDTHKKSMWPVPWWFVFLRIPLPSSEFKASSYSVEGVASHGCRWPVYPVTDRLCLPHTHFWSCWISTHSASTGFCAHVALPTCVWEVGNWGQSCCRVFSAYGHAPWAHCTRLAKHRFTDTLIENGITSTAEH